MDNEIAAKQWMYIQSIPESDEGPRQPEILGKHKGNFWEAEVWQKQSRRKGLTEGVSRRERGQKS